jgi:Cu-Zn family superoxide dismutase
MKQFWISAAIFGMVVTLALAQPPQPEPTSPPPMPPKHEMMTRMGTPVVEHAICVLYPTQGNQVHGTVTFEALEKGVRVVMDVQGLAPGKHGFHVHEFGDCSAPDAASAGGHFNPMQKPHGAPTDEQRHAGDLGNLTADASGNAQLEWTDPVMTLRGPHSIIGHSVVLHAKEDDLKSQPSGESGARVACGVIGIAKTP